MAFSAKLFFIHTILIVQFNSFHQSSGSKKIISYVTNPYFIFEENFEPLFVVSINNNSYSTIDEHEMNIINDLYGISFELAFVNRRPLN